MALIALEILGDEFQREFFDEGHDKAAITERVQACLACKCSPRRPLFSQVRQGGDRGARAGGKPRGALAQQRWLLRRRVPRLMTTDEPPTVGSQRGAAMGTVEDESGSQRRCGA